MAVDFCCDMSSILYPLQGENPMEMNLLMSFQIVANSDKHQLRDDKPKSIVYDTSL